MVRQISIEGGLRMAISQKMNENHHRQNHVWSERMKFKHREYLERIDKQRDIVSRNCYQVQRKEQRG
jgi:hypothetical protein